MSPPCPASGNQRDEPVCQSLLPSPPGRHGRPRHDLRRNLSPALRAAARRRPLPPRFRPRRRGACRRRQPHRQPRRTLSTSAAGRVGAVRQLLPARMPSPNCSPRASMSSASPRRTTAISSRARLALAAGKHVLIEKPSVLRLQELDELDALARSTERAGQGRLPQAGRSRSQEAAHPRRRRRAAARQQRLLLAAGAEADQRQQFAEWITGRNPGTYVAVHYIKLIDFTFGPPQVASGPHQRHRPARPGRRRRTARPGIRCSCRWSTPTPTAARRRSTSTPAG